ncbi:carboxymuconolactone decarboxylase family protein [Franconibacter helveticus 513]|uniref:carboxymuconolactone decarboxylase family protein n=1 Tax=Franconibacter helveticus TaxID=357240 RepID=UPI000418E4DE|nr:carboxymuconolactone decarboxylase family protein [Franconibacter helveticus]MDU6925443.1 carboxymuconolactone decarboxylase family protein [Franconibacter helveticus]
MSQRLNYFQAAGDLANKCMELSAALSRKPVIKELGQLIMLRASQLNGCAFCVDMHVKEARMHGERELRLHHVAVWRESTLFSARERAALGWTEALTRLTNREVSDEEWIAVREYFTEEEIAQISFQIAAINSWNRMGVAFRTVPGSADAAYGLDKAGLN